MLHNAITQSIFPTKPPLFINTPLIDGYHYKAEFISKAYEFLPEEDKERFYRMRTRPRRAGKPL